MLGARFRKLSVCIALTANSIRSSIGSLFFHGMPRFYLTTPPKSVTYVLNLLCYLCSEPAPDQLSARLDTSNIRPSSSNSAVVNDCHRSKLFFFDTDEQCLHQRKPVLHSVRNQLIAARF